MHIYIHTHRFIYFVQKVEFKRNRHTETDWSSIRWFTPQMVKHQSWSKGQIGSLNTIMVFWTNTEAQVQHWPSSAGSWTRHGTVVDIRDGGTVGNGLTHGTTTQESSSHFFQKRKLICLFVWKHSDREKDRIQKGDLPSSDSLPKTATIGNPTTCTELYIKIYFTATSPIPPIIYELIYQAFSLQWSSQSNTRYLWDSIQNKRYH